jgi:hypothetical protein
VFNWVELISRSKTAFREISWKVLNIALQRGFTVAVRRELQMRHPPLSFNVTEVGFFDVFES